MKITSKTTPVTKFTTTFTLNNMKITSKITPCVKPVKTFTIELTEEEAAILRKWAGGVAVGDAMQSLADSLYYSLTYESH